MMIWKAASLKVEETYEPKEPMQPSSPKRLDTFLDTRCRQSTFKCVATGKKKRISIAFFWRRS